MDLLMAACTHVRKTLHHSERYIFVLMRTIVGTEAENCHYIQLHLSTAITCSDKLSMWVCCLDDLSRWVSRTHNIPTSTT